MDNIQAHKLSGIDHVISESLAECIENIFDERNGYLVEEACDFISCLESLFSCFCENSETGELLEATIRTAKERYDEVSESEIPINQLLNIKSNMGITHITDDNQPLPDVFVFSTLYNKGYIKDSYMQKHVATQLQTLRSTALDLMGKDRVSGALRPKTPQVSISDWIDYQSVTGWNSSLAKGTMAELPSIETLLTAMLPQSDRLGQSIEEGTYDAMSVNMLMSYVFASVVASIVKQGLEITKGYYDFLEDLISFQRNFGSNGFFVANAMALNLAFVIELQLQIGDVAEPKGLAAILQDSVLRQNAKTFERWAEDERNSSILLPSRNDYPNKLASLLQKAQTVFGISVTDQAAKLGVPIPISMQKLSGNTLEGRRDNMLEESVKIGLGIAEIDTIESLMEGDIINGEVPSTCSDSLAEGLQVESWQMEGASPLASLSILQIHRTIMEHQNRLFNNALRHDHDALKISLAENLLLLDLVNPMLQKGMGLNLGELKLLAEDAKQMDFQNKKYIDVVETDSMESLREYADDNRVDLTNGILAIVKGV